MDSSSKDTKLEINKKISFRGEISEKTKRIIINEFIINQEHKYLHINLNFPEEKKIFFYIQLIDSNNILRVQHLSVNASSRISIGKDKSDCSIGVYPGEICKGKWKLILLIQGGLKDKENLYYRLEVENSDETIKEKIYKLGEDLWVDYKKEEGLLSLNNYDWNKKISSEARWYKGDFHTHTILSDGKMDNELYMKTAMEMNLDYAFPTDHNILPTGWKRSEEVLIIPGIEITLEKGHFNILGAKNFPVNIVKLIEYANEVHSFQEKLVEKVLHDWRDNEALYSINHPVLEFWKWKLNEIELSKIDAIEICNDPTYYLGPDSNDKAIELLDTLWNDGYKIYGIGGSDAHILPTEKYENSKERSIIGDPGTFVYCNGLTPNNILDGVRKGHVYVSRGLLLDLNISVTEENNKLVKENTYFPGDEISIKAEEAMVNYFVKVKAENIEGDFGKVNETKGILEAYLVENGKIVSKKEIKNGEVSFEVKWKKDEFNWLRIEIRTLDNKFKAYVNPIYNGKKASELKTFQDLLDYKFKE